MNQVQEEQAAIREEIDLVKSKINQIFETIQTLARKEEEICNVATARNNAHVQGPII